MRYIVRQEIYYASDMTLSRKRKFCFITYHDASINKVAAYKKKLSFKYHKPRLEMSPKSVLIHNCLKKHFLRSVGASKTLEVGRYMCLMYLNGFVVRKKTMIKGKKIKRVNLCIR